MEPMSELQQIVHGLYLVDLDIRDAIENLAALSAHREDLMDTLQRMEPDSEAVPTDPAG